ncbi:hypothetical protein LIER_07857 [Lithospermum erythrorhizon]|uniref:Uncharacterized protein n=1 Tax=Lithospermum erythrorhizon TaxID=34254 RepID=A0AAV3P9V3_LITER
MDESRELDPFYADQLNPSLWDTRVYVYDCPYLGKRVSSHWSLTPIKGMSSGNNDVPETTAPPPAPISTGRSDPQVTVIDPETLAFFRLWTTVGAEITYGDLIFSPTQDPFSNIVLPQEVTQRVAGRIDSDEEIMGNESATASLSTSRSPEPLLVKPLAISEKIR